MATRRSALRHLLMLSFFIGQSLALSRPSSVKLEDNEYTGVLFAIHPDIPEDPALIEELKSMITDASPYLYRATKKRAYFKTVTILIPQTWTDNPIYEQPKNASFSNADVIVAAKNPRFHLESQFPSSPYCKHFEGCGKQSAYIHFTTDFLLNSMTELLFGNKGRILVHEWGHFRWGLFNEYADEIADPDHSQEFYFSQSKNKWVPTRCGDGEWTSYNLKYDEKRNRYRYCSGNENIGYEEGCVSIPSGRQDHVTGSIMYGYTSIDNIVDFCAINMSTAMHIPEVPNKHNRLCDSKSSWEVMMEHSDFKDGNNPPSDIDDVTPTIILARARPRRIVLVLDTSSSMKNKRISKLASSTRNYLTTLLTHGNWIGLVEFNQVGKIISPLREVSNANVTYYLASLVPVETARGTCIGCGLQKAFEVLSEGGADPRGGEILLITDGIDSFPAKTRRMKNLLLNSTVTVNAVAFSNTAEKNVINIQRATGGRLWYQTDDPESTGLYDAFMSTVQANTEGYEKRIELISASNLFEVDERRTYGIFIDSTIGRKTSFDFAYYVSADTAPLEVEIISPSGITYNSDYSGYGIDLTFKMIHVIIQDAERGFWNIKIQNTYNRRQEIFMAVSSFARSKDVEPIIATSELSGSLSDFANGEPLTVYVEVRQGFNPVIHARVIAVIERPPDGDGIQYPPVEMQLYDNGAGADITRDDGIYSRYFTNYTGVGYYGLKLKIDNNGGLALILKPGDGNAPYSHAHASVDPVELLKGNIPQIDGETVLLPGMPLPEPLFDTAPEFSRTVGGGSSRVSSTPENWKPGDDILAPIKITDLTVTATSFQNRTVSLSFTAPGDDLDQGTASYYVMRYSSSPSHLMDDFMGCTPINAQDVLEGNLQSPRAFGTHESFLVVVPVDEDAQAIPYAFAVHAVDDSGKAGSMSNVVQATLRRYIPTAPDDPDAPQPGGADGGENNGGVVLFAIIAVIAVLVLLGVVLLMVAGMYLRRKSSEGK